MNLKQHSGIPHCINDSEHWNSENQKPNLSKSWNSLCFVVSLQSIQSIELFVDVFYVWCTCKLIYNDRNVSVRPFTWLRFLFCRWSHCAAIDFFSCFQFTFHYDFDARFFSFYFFFLLLSSSIVNIFCCLKAKVCNSISETSQLCVCAEAYLEGVMIARKENKSRRKNKIKLIPFNVQYSMENLCVRHFFFSFFYFFISHSKCKTNVSTWI